MKKTVLLLCSTLVVCCSCMAQEKDKDLDPFGNLKFEEYSRTKYEWNEKEGCYNYTTSYMHPEDAAKIFPTGSFYLLPCGIRENDRQIVWILRDLAKYEKAVQVLRTSKYARAPHRYSVNNSKKQIEIVEKLINEDGGYDYYSSYNYKLNYDENGYISEIDLKENVDDGGTHNYSIGWDGAILLETYSQYIFHQNAYTYKDGKPIFSISKYEDGIEGSCSSWSFTQYYYDNVGNLIKTITTEDEICNEEVTEYEWMDIERRKQVVEEFTYKDGKLAESKTKKREIIVNKTKSN